MLVTPIPTPQLAHGGWPGWGCADRGDVGGAVAVASLLNVRPTISSHDVAHIAQANSELLGQLLSTVGPTSKQAPQGAHVIRSEFAMTDHERRATAIASLANAVEAIVQMGTQKEMGGIDASRNVTPMENALPVWDRALEVQIGNPMGSHMATARLAEIRTANPKPSISPSIETTLPNPTPTGIGALVYQRKVLSETSGVELQRYTAHVTELQSVAVPGAFVALPGVSLPELYRDSLGSALKGGVS